MNYFDTSALIKLFVSERGSEVVERLVTTSRAVCTASIAYAEVHAGLSRRWRAGHLSAREYRATRDRFDGQWRRYLRMDLRAEVLERARDLVQRHPLRGLDAIHLASALTLGASLGEAMRFVAADARLIEAAESERCPVLNVERGAR